MRFTICMSLCPFKNFSHQNKLSLTARLLPAPCSSWGPGGNRGYYLAKWPYFRLFAIYGNLPFCQFAATPQIDAAFNFLRLALQPDGHAEGKENRSDQTENEAERRIAKADDELTRRHHPSSRSLPVSSPTLRQDRGTSRLGVSASPRPSIGLRCGTPRGNSRRVHPA